MLHGVNLGPASTDTVMGECRPILTSKGVARILRQGATFPDTGAEFPKRGLDC